MGTSYNPRIVTENLVFCVDAANERSYPGSGTNFADVSKIKNTTTLVNNPTYNNNYFSFDGSDDHIVLSDSSSVDVSSEKTFEIWIRFNTFPVGTAISLFNKRLTSASQLEYFIFVWTNQGNRITFDYSNNTSRWKTNYSPPLNEWVHIVLNVNTALPRRNLYVNGEYKTGSTITMSTLTGYSNDVFIGKNNVGSNIFFLNGDIGLARIYNKYLSAEEIRQNYLATKERYA
jgi:hypothetical protein